MFDIAFVARTAFMFIIARDAAIFILAFIEAWNNYEESPMPAHPPRDPNIDYRAEALEEAKQLLEELKKRHGRK